MKLAIAGDSAVLPMITVICAHLKQRADLGILGLSVLVSRGDGFYASLADRVATGVLDSTYDRVKLIWGTGNGVYISANKVPEIRAVLTHDTYSAERATLSSNAQIITMGARVVGP